MQFKIIEDAFRECREHLKETDTHGSETEIRLTAFLSVLISAHFEVRVESIIESYAKKLDDRRLQSFLTGAARKQLRAPDIRSIAAFLSLFDAKWVNLFRRKAGDQAISAYDSIISNRHDFVIMLRVTSRSPTSKGTTITVYLFSRHWLAC